MTTAILHPPVRSEWFGALVERVRAMFNLASTKREIEADWLAVGDDMREQAARIRQSAQDIDDLDLVHCTSEIRASLIRAADDFEGTIAVVEGLKLGIDPEVLAIWPRLRELQAAAMSARQELLDACQWCSESYRNAIEYDDEKESAWANRVLNERASS